MARVLVLGATGMLGHKVCQLLPAHGCDVAGAVRWTNDRRQEFPTVFDGARLLTNVDVLHEGALEAAIADAQPDVVVNCAGIVKQRPQSQDPLLSIAVNSLLPHRLARLCALRGCRLIHISTDCVFDGTRGRYRESDFCDAKDLYGKSKHLGETTDEQPCAVTLRTSMIGRELTDPAHGLLEWLLAQQGKCVRGYARAVFSGLTTHELSHVIARVIQDGTHLRGVYHVASPPITKYELLQLIGEAYALDIEIERDESFVCDRSLVMERFSAEMGYAPPAWEAMVAEMREDRTPYFRFTQSQWRCQHLSSPISPGRWLTSRGEFVMNDGQEQTPATLIPKPS